MEQTIFSQLSIVIVIGAIVSLLMRLLRQPLIMGYILTGILVGPSFFNLIKDKEAFEAFSELGIALLLFIIGLGLSIGIIRSLGKVVLLTAALIIAGVGSSGYIVTLALGFTPTEAVIAAVALLFSSTIIVVKVLSDKKEQSRLYGQIAVGVLLLEDIVATLALVAISASATSGSESTIASLGWLLAKGVLLAGMLFLAGAKIIPRLGKFFASSQETLFLFAVGWGFGIASLFEISGFSMEVGALFAGVTLGSLPYSQEISARLKPLRDFFVVLFFIILGEKLHLEGLANGLVPALALSMIVLLGKPLFTIISLGVLGYTKRTSFKTAIHLSQISEFSIIFVVLAANYQLVGEQLSTVITMVAIITIAVSTYLMNYDDKLYGLLEHRLRLFERKVVHDEKKAINHYPLVLFGYRKGGHEFVRTFKEMRKRFVIVDYSPDVIETLEHQRLPYVYGDATDFELLEEIDIAGAKLVVSTITDYEINSVLVRHIHHVNPRAVIVCHADNYDEAAELYEKGATYVMLPHLIGSERISSFIRRRGTSKEAFESYRDKHLVSLGRAAFRSRR